MHNFGFVKVAAASPKLKVADPFYNISQIEEVMRGADTNNAALIVFSELSVTGYTCGDLFGQRLLLDKSETALAKLLNNTRDIEIIALIGLPILVEQSLYNCAVAIGQGQIIGIVPKMYLPNYKEFYEKRWFNSGQKISSSLSKIDYCGQKAPFGNLIFKSIDAGFSFGIEVCEDLWTVIPPSSYLALKGATIIANLSASNELVSKSDYRRQLVQQQSARCISGYVYASAGVHESTTDNVFGGDLVIAENGYLLQTGQRFSRENTVIYADIDVERLDSERQVSKSFSDNSDFTASDRNFQTVEFTFGNQFSIKGFDRHVSPHPFIPDNPVTRDERCQEIFNIQVAGLAKRIEHTGIRKAVLGISGGLDSTLALLVIAKTFKVLDISSENIIAVTMPGFGTTDTTYQNAMQLMKSIQVSIREIDIKPACIQHFKDIGHDINSHDVTYENVQARERTQVLMDIANKINGLVVGTGDLSELALGWSTYNGDHMSMYAVNSGVPKTLVRFLVQWVADNAVDDITKEVLYKIIDTPISPELLPPDESGRIKQKTEDTVGPYELHDFFLYYAVRYGMSPRKIQFLAETAFQKKYSSAEIIKWLQVFYKRFFTQQFKRSCLPDGPKVGTISLSPRGDWRMPSDASFDLWLKELT